MSVEVDHKGQCRPGGPGALEVECGILFTPPHPRGLRVLAQDSEAAGFTMLALGDSQSLFREVYTSLAVAAMSTSTIRIATGVSNVLTRHPAVIASSAATLNEISAGRFVLGLGTGDSAVYNLGLKAVTRAQLTDTIALLRQLLRGEWATYDDREIHTRWASHRVPIYVTAEGPKALRLAGAIADGVIVGSGLLPEVISGSLALIEEGAAAANRSIDDIDVWFFAKSNLADSDEAAVRDIKMALAASGNHAFRFHREGKWIPAELVGQVEQLVERYRTSEHEQLGDTHNARLTDDVGLTDYLADRFAVAGSPASVLGRLQELKARGVSKVLLGSINPDPHGFVRRWTTDVAPHIAGTRSSNPAHTQDTTS